jgi:adenylate cyclase
MSAIMAEQSQSSSWLERAGGERIVLRGTCALGRSPSNQIVLSDDKVSRRHAMIHVQDQDEFWLVDLGSSNGTYVNGGRVTQPIQLRDQDEIEICKIRLLFRQPLAAKRSSTGQTDTEKTSQDVHTSQRWLLIADIEGSTQLSRRLSADELPVVSGQWFSTCKQVLEDCSGTINKYLGDGFLAYWTEMNQAPQNVACALTELKKSQESAQLRFRIVVHYGRVFAGGIASAGEESLFGPEVNFVFRMERLAAVLGVSGLLSAAAHAKLGALVTTTEAGRHPLPGFDGDFLFFSF